MIDAALHRPPLEVDLRVALIDFEYFDYSVQLANALAESCRVTLMLPDQAADRYAGRLAGAVSLHRFRMPRLRYPSNIGMVRSIFRDVKNLAPHVVHQPSWNLWMNMALPLFPDIPLVATIHDVSRHPGDRETFTWLQSWQWRRADQVIVHARSLRDQLVGRYRVSADKVQVIPIGAYDLYRTAGAEDVPEQGHTLLFFGRIWEYKGLRYLIEAEPLITAAVPDVRIVIAGQGEPFARYEQLMVNRDRFVVHNCFIPEERIARLFQQASVVVLPYSEASQSAVLAMAYAFGKPVVATAVGGLPDVVEHGQTGYLVPPRDPARLAEAVIRLLKDRTLREEMGRKALARARGDLSWSSIARKTAQVYRRALAVHAGR